jgi:hypothetical protein
MSNWYIYWFFTHILLGILIFKGLTARRLYMSSGVKGLKQKSNKNTAKLQLVALGQMEPQNFFQN